MNKTWHNFCIYASIVASISLAVYAQTFFFDYTYLDDNNLIIDRQEFYGRPSSLYRIFSGSFFGNSSGAYYRPVVNFTFAVNMLADGIKPVGYHIANVLFHAMSCVLFLSFLLMLGMGSLPAFTASVLFALHPVNVSAISWIPGRNDVLLGCFFFLSCIFLLKYLRKPGIGYGIWHTVFFFLALLTKETALCFPVIFVFLIASQNHRAFFRRQIWLSWLAAAAVYFTIRYMAISSRPEFIRSLFNTAISRWYVMFSELGKLVCPVKLQVLAAPKDILLWPCFISASAIAGVFFIRGARKNILLFAVSCILLPIVMSLFGDRYVVLENRLYIPISGICIIAGETLRAIKNSGKKTAYFFYGVVIAACLFSGVTDVFYSRNFSDRRTFSNAAIKASPNSGIAANLVFRANYNNNLDNVIQKRMRSQ
jgi:protein O-mannosyl-transferase